jgi:hypothetical protein
MAVDRFQGFDGHAEVASRLPKVGTVLHRPGGCGVPERVRRDVLKSGGAYRTGKALPDGMHRLVIPFDDRMHRNAEAMPAV